MAFIGVSQNKFEENCGLTHTNLREKKQGPTVAYLMKILTTYPQLSMDWLFRGTGNMILGELPQVPPPASINIQNVQTVNIGNWAELVELLNRK
jgi:hypothetical protein